MAIVRTEDKRIAARERRRRANEELILEAAERVFSEHGFDGAKIQDIADEAGFALGTVYKLFKGKAEVFTRVHDRRGEALAAVCDAALEGCVGPVDQLVSIVRAYLQDLTSNPDYLRMHLRDSSAWGFGRSFSSRSQARSWARGHDMEVQIVEAGQAEGLFVGSDASLLVRMMAAMQQVQLAHWLEASDAPSAEDLIDRMCGDLVRCFCSPRVIEWLRDRTHDGVAREKGGAR